MKMQLQHTLLTLVAAGALSGSVFAQSPLYLENFSTTGGFVRPATAVGWKAFVPAGNPNSAYNLAELADPGGVQYNSPLGNPDGISNNPVAGAEYGVVFWSPTVIFNVAIVTQENAGALQASEIGTIVWDYHTDAPSSFDGTLLMRALVQVGGSAADTDNWYVSDPMIAVDTASLADGGSVDGFYQGLWETAAVPAGGEWIRMPSFDYANNTLAWPGSAEAKTAEDFAGFPDYTFEKGALPSGTIHGFGVFIDNRAGGNLWIDNYALLEAAEAPMIPVARIALTGSDIEIRFDSENGINYQLQKSTGDLSSFADTGASLTGDGAEKVFKDTAGVPSAGSAFYRVSVGP